MMANVVRMADPNMGLSMLMSEAKDSRTMSFLADNYNNFVSAVGTRAGSFMNTVQNAYSYYSNREVLDDARYALEAGQALTNTNVIYELGYDDIYHASDVMRRYVMAEPTIYERYSNNRMSGYDDQWWDNDPDVIPTMRTDYLNAVDEVLQHDEDGNGYILYVSTSEENPLTIRERLGIQKTWDLAKHMMANEIDPTDLEGGN